MRVAGVLCLCLCLVACDEEDRRPQIEFDVVVEGPRGIIMIDDAARVPFEWGFQGGTMIRPGVLIPADVATEDDEIRLVVRHRPDPDFPDAFFSAGDFPDVVRDTFVQPFSPDRWLVGPVDHQLGRSAISGMRLLLDITVSGRSFKGHQQLRVQVAGAPSPSPCDGFSQSGADCVYRSLALPMFVSAHEPAPDCPNAVVPIVSVIFESDDPETLRCAESLRPPGPAPWAPFPGLEAGADADCLKEMGLGIEHIVNGRAAVQIEGYCAAIVIEPDDDFSACALCQ